MENRIHRTEIQIYVSPFLIVIFLLMSISSYAQQIIAKQMPFLEQLPSNEVELDSDPPRDLLDVILRKTNRPERLQELADA